MFPLETLQPWLIDCEGYVHMFIVCCLARHVPSNDICFYSTQVNYSSSSTVDMKTHTCTHHSVLSNVISEGCFIFV